MERVYQVELEILYFMLPSLLNNSQNSFQELSGKVTYMSVSPQNPGDEADSVLCGICPEASFD